MDPGGARPVRARRRHRGRHLAAARGGGACRPRGGARARRRGFARRVQEATTLARAGRYDLLAQASREIVARVLAEFKGYDQLTRRGNRFVITSLETRFAKGHAEVLAHADFDWRWGLYDGPILVRYDIFAGIDADDALVLHFRVAEVQTLASWRVFNSFLAPILTLRMQDSLKIRDVPLPLGLRRPPAAQATRCASAVRSGAQACASPCRRGRGTSAPSRAGDLRRGEVGRSGREPARIGAARRRRGAHSAPRGVELAVRLDFLTDLLSSRCADRTTSRSRSIVCRASGRTRASFRRRLRQPSRPAERRRSDRHLGCRTTLNGSELGLDVELSGRFAGTANARLFGCRLRCPSRCGRRSINICAAPAGGEDGWAFRSAARDERAARGADLGGAHGAAWELSFDHPPEVWTAC
jgi:hypothetical protein